MNGGSGKSTFTFSSLKLSNPEPSTPKMSEEKEEVDTHDHDPHYEPIVTLPTVEIKTLEDEEQTILKLRAKLYRYDSTAEPPEWKERGTGECKILQHKTNKLSRILMRRDKTLKICANHYIAPGMELKPNCGSDRAWVWSAPADFADQEAKAELLAIRFRDAETAQKFKTTFDDAKKAVKVVEDGTPNGESSPTKSDSKEQKADDASEDVTGKLEKLSVKEGGDDKETAAGDTSTKGDQGTTGAGHEQKTETKAEVER